VNDILGSHIDEEDIDTFGGCFMAQRFDIVKGEKMIEQGYEFLVKDMEGHHILYVEVQKIEKESESLPAEDAAATDF